MVAVLIWRRPAIDALLFLLANDKFVQPIPRKTFFRTHETIVTAIAGSLNVMEWPLALLFPIRGGFGIYMHPKSWHCQKGGDSAPCQDFFGGFVHNALRALQSYHSSPTHSFTHRWLQSVTFWGILDSVSNCQYATPRGLIRLLTVGCK